MLEMSSSTMKEYINPLNAKLNPICHLLALLGAHHILHVSRIRFNNREEVPNVSVFVLMILTCSLGTLHKMPNRFLYI